MKGRLAISVTRLAFSPYFMPFLKDEVISHFTSNHDIIECIIASALIPFALNGRPWHRYRDWRICMDAGITNIPGVLRSYEGFPSIIPHRPADEQSLYVQQEQEELSQSQLLLRSREELERGRSVTSSAHVEADEDYASDDVSVSDSDSDSDDVDDEDGNGRVSGTGSSSSPSSSSLPSSSSSLPSYVVDTTISNSNNSRHNNHHNQHHNNDDSSNNSSMATTWLTLWDLMAHGAPPSHAHSHTNEPINANGEGKGDGSRYANVNGNGNVTDTGRGYSNSDYGDDVDLGDGDLVVTNQQPQPQSQPQPRLGDNALMSLLRSYISFVRTVGQHCVGTLVHQGKTSGQGLGRSSAQGQGLGGLVSDRSYTHPRNSTPPSQSSSQPSQQPPIQIGPVQNLGTGPSPGAGTSPGPGAGAGTSPGPGAGTAWSGSSLLERLAAFNLQAYHRQQQQQQQQQQTRASSSSSSSSSNHIFNMVPYLTTPLGQQRGDAELTTTTTTHPYDEWRGVRQHGQGLGLGLGLGPGLGQELVHRGYNRHDQDQEGTIRSSSSVDNSEHSSILLLPVASRPYGLAYLGRWVVRTLPPTLTPNP